MDMTGTADTVGFPKWGGTMLGVAALLRARSGPPP